MPTRSARPYAGVMASPMTITLDSVLDTRAVVLPPEALTLYSRPTVMRQLWSIKVERRKVLIVKIAVFKATIMMGNVTCIIAVLEQPQKPPCQEARDCRRSPELTYFELTRFISHITARGICWRRSYPNNFSSLSSASLIGDSARIGELGLLRVVRVSYRIVGSDW